MGHSPHMILTTSFGSLPIVLTDDLNQEPATRKPLLLFSLFGLLLLRLDDCKLLELLFQLPPRSTRDSTAVCPQSTRRRFTPPAPWNASANFAHAPRVPPMP